MPLILDLVHWKWILKNCSLHLNNELALTLFNYTVSFSQVILLSLFIKEKYIYKVIHSDYRTNLLTEKSITQETYSFKRLIYVNVFSKAVVKNV